MSCWKGECESANAVSSEGFQVSSGSPPSRDTMHGLTSGYICRRESVLPYNLRQIFLPSWTVLLIVKLSIRSFKEREQNTYAHLRTSDFATADTSAVSHYRQPGRGSQSVNMPAHNTPKPDEIEVGLVESVEDFLGMSDCAAKAFGDQVHDAMYVSLERDRRLNMAATKILSL